MLNIKRLSPGADAERIPIPRRVLWLAEQLPRGSEVKDPVAFWRDGQWARRLERKNYTGLGNRRARTLLRLARTIERERIPGVMVDCGVWNGGSTILLSIGAPSRAIWAFDSFEGMPEPGQHDDRAAQQFVGDARGSEEKLRAGFEQYASPHRLQVARGLFEDTFERFAEDISTIAVLHIDADWHDSVKLALDTFYPKLAPGGYCAVDDYTYWTGTRRAVDDFRAAHGITVPVVSNYYWRNPFQDNHTA